MKRSTHPKFGVHPDPSSAALDNLLADGKTNPRPLVLLSRDQTLEDLEDALFALRIHADPIVSDGDQPILFSLFCSHVDLGNLVTTKLDGIVDEVLEQLSHQDFIDNHRWQRTVCHLRSPFLQGDTEVTQGLLEDIFQ